MLSETPQAFGILLRRYRLAADLTQEALAERASLSTRAISDLERGVNRGPQPATLQLLTEALGLSDEERACLEASARRGSAPPAAVHDRRLAPHELAPNGHVAHNVPTVADGAPHGATDATGSLDQPNRSVAHMAPPPAVFPPSDQPPPPHAGWARRLHRGYSAILIGLVVLAGVALVPSGLAQLSRVRVLGVVSSLTTPIPVRGGVWTHDVPEDPTSLIPNGGGEAYDSNMQFDQALYLPLFYGDANGVIHPGAALEIPTQRNGGVNGNATIWTFHLRPGLVWSDGQPYDARDVDYTWKLWSNPGFVGDFPLTRDNKATDYQAILSATVSADHRSITFALKRPNATFPLLWVDGVQAPLPAHHFGTIAAAQFMKLPDTLHPVVTSGPFVFSDSRPGDHYTLARNARYYLASKGLPYLDTLVFHVVASDGVLQDFRVGAADSVDLERSLTAQSAQPISGTKLVIAATSATFEALWFNFHNVVLATNPEVREAIARAVDYQALIQGPLHGLATPLCTDHPSALHPGYQPNAFCPAHGIAASNKVLDDAGWVRGPDGVRARGGQRLEFEYSTSIAADSWRDSVQQLIQRELLEIGIKLDIQNYPGYQFFNSVLPAGKPSPPAGAVAGRFDIAEYAWRYGYNPDDSTLLACDQRPSIGGSNIGSYCNPDLDALFQQELATTDPGLRQTIFDQEHLIYVTQFPLLVLFSPLSASIVRTRTHNYSPSPITGATINVWEWWCDQGKC